MAEATTKAGWHVPTGADFLAVPRSELSDAAKIVLLALCARARSKAYTWVGTAELARMTGRGTTSVGKALRELERAGAVYRSMAPRRRTVRVGIVLRRRPDSGRWPAADTPDRLNAAILALAAERRAWGARRRGPVAAATAK